VYDVACGETPKLSNYKTKTLGAFAAAATPLPFTMILSLDCKLLSISHQHKDETENLADESTSGFNYFSIRHGK
jgi:hypothetical protein